MDNLRFFQGIAPNDEMAIANRMKNLALEEFKLFSTNGESSKFVSMMLYAQWIERTTKVLLTLYQRDQVSDKVDLAKANKNQYHRIVEPIQEIWNLGHSRSIGPGYWPLAKDVLENEDVQAFLTFVENGADASVGRYHNLNTLAGEHDNIAFTMGLSSILTTAATNRLGTEQYRLDRGDFAVVEDHVARFLQATTDVLTFILHFPVGQGVFGDRARQEVAFQFNPIPPKFDVFEYLINNSKL